MTTLLHACVARVECHGLPVSLLPSSARQLDTDFIRSRRTARVKDPGRCGGAPHAGHAICFSDETG